LAQALLARSQAVLLAPNRAPASLFALQAALWSAGIIAVPLGVLAEARLAVVIGSAFLLTALVSFGLAGKATKVALKENRDLWLFRFGQLILVAFMTISVAIGTALAWHTPWL
jgi:hypothetical protein